MFVNTVVLGSKLNLLLLFNENNNITPSSATLRMYTPAVASPYYAQIGADIDILVSGGEVATGLWGITVDTSGYSAGQYSLYVEWVSPVSGYTYASNASFNVAADASAVLSTINAQTAQISRIPFPDNKSIAEIRNALGVKSGWDITKMVTDSETKHASITGSLKDIVKRLSKINETSATIKENVKINDSKKTVELSNASSELKFEIQRSLDAMNNALRSLTMNQPSRNDMFASFDLFSKEMASLFGKVDIVREQLIELEAKLAEMEAVIPSVTADNLSGMAAAAAQESLRRSFAPQNPQQGMGQPMQNQNMGM